MKKGDKIVCINNSGIDKLSLGKVYTVVEDFYSAWNDEGLVHYYDIEYCNPNNDFIMVSPLNILTVRAQRFISLKEYRKNKLNKILCSV